MEPSDEIAKLKRIAQEALEQLSRVIIQNAEVEHQLAEAEGCLTELLKMVKEDEESPVMHNENCSAWCHYRPVLERSEAYLERRKKS